jgi:GntR family transcriptional regulator, transcriptional repressor for pyruvate dehydrogenase complex
MKERLSFVYRKDNLADEVTKKLQELLVKGQIRPGEKLPPIKELADLFGVGISSVREGISALKRAGLLKSYPGKGTFVCHQNSTPTIYTWLGLPNSEGQVVEIIEARVLIEKQINILAAKKAKPDQVKKLEIILENMENYVEDLDKYIKLDSEFHLLVAKCTQNMVLTKMYRAILASIKLVIIKNVEISYENWNGSMLPSLESHKKLLTAIKNKDIDLIEEVSDEYLNRALTFYNKNPYMK